MKDVSGGRRESIPNSLRRCLLRCTTLVLLFPLCFASPNTAPADELLASFPPPGTKGSKIAITVTAGESNRVGICPVTVVVRAIGPSFGAERKLTIELRPRLNPPSHNTFDFRQTITLQESDSVYEETFAVPAYYRWYHCRVRVLEAGVLLPGFDSSLSKSVFLTLGRLPELTIAIIEARTVDSDPPAWQRFPDCRSLSVGARGERPSSIYWQPPQLDHEQAKQSAETTSGSPVYIRRTHEDRLPPRWTDYNFADAILVSEKTLQRIHEESPPEFESLRQWLAAGGLLWCYGDAGTAGLDELFSLTNPWDRIPLQKIQESLQPQTARFPGATGLNTPPSGLDPGRRRVASGLDLEHPFLLLEGTRSIQQRIQTAPYLAGKIVYLDDPFPFPGSPNLWMAVIGESRQRIGTENRLGMNIANGDNNFWNWLIAEVGQPPVYKFLGMISLFVLLVGPVSYYLFLYLKRLYLFFVFAPIVALICTAVIGLYALIADGFGSRVRVRHLTLLNSAGDGITWSRQTYFSGLRPRDGVAWSRDSAVYPLRELQDSASLSPITSEPASAQIAIDDDVIRLTGSFMPSRTQSQFIVISPTQNAGSVIAHAGDGLVRVENQTAYPIQSILLADASNHYWLAESLDSGATVDATALLAIDAARWMTTNYLDYAPELPAGFQDASQSELLRLGNRRLRSQHNQSIFFSDNEGGLVEAMFRTAMVEQGTPPANRFIALADLPDRAIGIEDAKPVECIHMIMGEVQFEGHPNAPVDAGDREVQAESENQESEQ
ncbi:hypothetical protein [Rosistilla oblonga]|uniref:Uncharacterized protein n=1 Tax=Rosistilla oblonga TaxID=2527990 RepID=A0A518IZ28_9BACT|nr:hypothetical protein [Rosistilla oblonga]QDV58344.1 hypothetical protein Mal33_43620 [Rosistilla oblonga]